MFYRIPIFVLIVLIANIVSGKSIKLNFKVIKYILPINNLGRQKCTEGRCVPATSCTTIEKSRKLSSMDLCGFDGHTTPKVNQQYIRFNSIKIQKKNLF